MLAIALALASCNAPSSPGMPSPPDGDVAGHDDGSVHQGGDAGTPPGPDARTADGGSTGRDAAIDGPSSSPDSGGSTGGAGAGIVSCYTVGDPGATCTLPVHCCFSNYSSSHDGSCMTSSCSWGTITCDGPEDCPSGQRCCSHVLVDPENGITGYSLACQASACGPAPANQELCHPTSSAAGTCSTGTACVTALGNDNDLPPSLYICQ